MGHGAGKEEAEFERVEGQSGEHCRAREEQRQVRSKRVGGDSVRRRGAQHLDANFNTVVGKDD